MRCKHVLWTGSDRSVSIATATVSVFGTAPSSRNSITAIRVLALVNTQCCLTKIYESPQPLPPAPLRILFPAVICLNLAPQIHVRVTTMVQFHICSRSAQLEWLGCSDQDPYLRCSIFTIKHIQLLLPPCESSRTFASKAIHDRITRRVP